MRLFCCDHLLIGHSAAGQCPEFAHAAFRCACRIYLALRRPSSVLPALLALEAKMSDEYDMKAKTVQFDQPQCSFKQRKLQFFWQDSYCEKI